MGVIWSISSFMAGSPIFIPDIGPMPLGFVGAVGHICIPGISSLQGAGCRLWLLILSADAPRR